jgi:hypothetical protein
MERQMCKQLWKIIWWIFKKLKQELVYDPEMRLVDISLRELKSESLNVCSHSHVHFSVIHSGQSMETN